LEAYALSAKLATSHGAAVRTATNRTLVPADLASWYRADLTEGAGEEIMRWTQESLGNVRAIVFVVVGVVILLAYIVSHGM
jgi:hypothetical protein